MIRRALVTTLVLASAPALAEDAFAQCHILCSNEAGRVETRFDPHAGEQPRIVLRVETIGIFVNGSYVDGAWRPMPSHGSAYALEELPTISVRGPLGWWLHLTMPWEENKAWNVITPSLHVTPGVHKEIAPGRLSLSLQKRLDDVGDSIPWVGFGYALSKSVGTVEVRPYLDSSPELAADSLGIGTNDLFVTGDLASFAHPGWEIVAGGELRMHALPHLSHIYGITGGYHLWVGHELSPRWTVGVRASGFHSVLTAVDSTQTTGLAVMPAIRREVGDATRVTVGVATQIPGATLNENALQTSELHVAWERAF